MKIFHPPLLPPIKGGKVPSPLEREVVGERYFRFNTIKYFIVMSKEEIDKYRHE